MPRYVQIQQDDGTFKYVEAHKAPPRPRVHLHTVRPSYASPIDGTPIEGRRAEREHMREHNVVPSGAFGPNDSKEYFERKAKERQEYFTGEAQYKEMKNDVVEATQKVSQGYKPQVERMKEDE